MKNLFICALLGMGLNASANDIFRIEIGKDYQSYSNSELQRRVWELERAVMQLQMRVFQLEMTKPAATPAVVESWSCTIQAMGEPYTATGVTKATATAKVLELCKAGQKGNGFFCKNPRCGQ